MFEEYHAEFDSLLSENYSLKQIIFVLQGTLPRSDFVYTNNDFHLLRVENQSLKAQIAILEHRVNVLENKLNEKEEERIVAQNHQNILIKEIKEEMQDLKNDLKNERIISQQKKNSDLTKSLIIAIQDLNRFEQLESNNYYPWNCICFNLRVQRTSDCHFFVDYESPEVFRYKLESMLRMLRSLDPSLKNGLFPPGFLKFIEEVLERRLTQFPNQAPLPEYQKTFIDNWWL
jgi:hypothetical protein